MKNLFGMKKLVAIALSIISSQVLGQKAEYKNNFISLDGKDIEKVLKIKDNAR